MNVYIHYPSCYVLYSAFTRDSLIGMNEYLNGYTHGPTHIYIGGAWVNDNSVENYFELKSYNKILLFKILWRMGYTRCPSTCSSSDDCVCSVPDEYIEKYTAKGILQSATVIDHLGLNTNESDSYYLGYLRVLENAGNAGEMFTSNAAYDPVFWSVHGTMERLLGLKRILVELGVVTNFDETWGFPTYSSTDSDIYIEGVADWSAVTSNEDLTLPSYNSSASCSGHGEDDTLPFGNFLSEGESYTNIEFYDFMSPWNDDLPYVFHTYDYDYCRIYDIFDFSTAY